MKKILILSGDPNSINSEIIYKSLKKIKPSIRKKIYVISNYRLFEKQLKKLNLPLKLKIVKNLNENCASNNIKILNINLNFKNPFDVPINSASKFVINSLNLGHKLALKDNVSGLINCAINKKLIKKNNSGVTEYLASKCKIKDDSEVMLIYNRKLAVNPITTHVDIKQVSKKIKTKLLVNKVITIHKWYKQKFNKIPKIAVLGLNPHNAELKKNSEEIKTIIPSINKLKRLKININGPLVADTLFIKEYKKYDVIVGMFHDQVITPFKTLFKFNAINVTLGLKYLRISPDHGVATGLIGKNKANSDSLTNCINFLHKFGK